MLTSAGISWNSNILWAPQWLQAGSSVTSDVGQVKKSGSPLQEYLEQGEKESWIRATFKSHVNIQDYTFINFVSFLENILAKPESKENPKAQKTNCNTGSHSKTYELLSMLDLKSRWRH